MQILGIAGSLRRQSFNRRLLAAVIEDLPADADLQLWGGLGQVPPFNEDAERPTPPAVRELRRLIAEADGLLIATPEYNGSIPGQLKNALDWASRPLEGATLAAKPVGVISASPSPYGGAWAQAELRKVLSVIGAEVVAHECAVPHVDVQFDQAGRVRDAEVRRRLAAVVEDLCVLIRRRPEAA